MLDMATTTVAVGKVGDFGIIEDSRIFVEKYGMSRDSHLELLMVKHAQL